MRDHGTGARERPTGSAVLSPSEKLACEWEARHDVAARARRVDAALALHRYLTRTRIEEDGRHQDQLAHRSEPPPTRHAPHDDDFAVQHPLAASWLRWGEDPR